MAIVKKYKVQVASIVNHFENVYTIELASIIGGFKYLPGQFLHLALDEYDPSSNWPESRCFSMRSSPKDPLIKITFAIKGNFTQHMANELVKGKIIDIKLPFGELFQQDHNTENLVFIAGGTGITPFLSAFTDQTFSKYSNPMLYFGVREKKFHIYHEELEIAQKLNPSLKVEVIFQNIDGVLNIDSIFNSHGPSSTYFISGPQGMISSFKKELHKKGVPEVNIKTDDWE